MTNITCDISGKKWKLEARDLEILQKLSMPLPRRHYSEILRNCMAMRNERHLYHRECDLSKKKIISAYSPDKPFPVYESSAWWSDDWNAGDYATNVDFSQTFIDQFKALQDRVPREGTSVVRCENSDFNGHTRDSRNCYLNALVQDCENCMYNYWIDQNKDLLDCMFLHESE